jgi:8-oxo-(d)GTP phosphatase
MPNNKSSGSKEGKESRLIRAAGAVAWRPGADGAEPEVLLVHRKKYDDWSLPKGKTEPGEPLPVTAVREVFEEGGARLVLGRRLTSVRYQAGGRPKRVHYWAARVSGVDTRAVPNSEVDQVTWLPATRARERASYEHDVRVLDDFTSQRADTVPLILLRHATAVPRREWDGDDTERPLDSAGRADAKALAPLLTCFAPVAQVISSVAVRCLDTVRPYADLTGAQVRAERALHVQSSGTEPADSAAVIAEAVRSGEPTVCCAHRENLPALQAAAIGALGAPETALPEEWGDTLPTSGFWVLHVAPSSPAPGVALAPGAAAAPVPSPDDPPPSRWRRWFRGGSVSRPGRPPGPALVAADCYDLSDV